MKDDTKPPKDFPATVSFDEFKALTAKLVQLPKSEVDAKESEYQKAQSKKPKRGPKKK
jgi:hypothetical protein